MTAGAGGERVCLAVRTGIALAFYGLVILLMFVSYAPAADLDEFTTSDPRVVEWFSTLMRPDYPSGSCCGVADAYWADDVEVRDGKVYAIITDTRPDKVRLPSGQTISRHHVPPGTKVLVPNEKIKWDRGNPTGHIVIFLNYSNEAICYVQGGGV